MFQQKKYKTNAEPARANGNGLATAATLDGNACQCLLVVASILFEEQLRHSEVASDEEPVAQMDDSKQPSHPVPAAHKTSADTLQKTTAQKPTARYKERGTSSTGPRLSSAYEATDFKAIDGAAAAPAAVAVASVLPVTESDADISTQPDSSPAEKNNTRSSAAKVLAETREADERRANLPELSMGTRCWHRQAESWVEVVKVYYDDLPPYYQVRMPDGSERGAQPHIVRTQAPPSHSSA